MVSCRCFWLRLVTGLLVFFPSALCSHPASAEWYVAGQVGANFADPLRNIRGTGTLAGLDAPNFNLKTSSAYGGNCEFSRGTDYSGSNWTCPTAPRISRTSMMCRGFI